MSLDELLAETDAQPGFVRELEEYGLLGARRGRQALHPARRGRGAALPAAGPLRRGRPPSAHDPLGGGPRGRAARADPGARAALLQPRAARGRHGGDGGAGGAHQRARLICCWCATCAPRRADRELLGLVLHEREDLVRDEPVAALQERELDHEGQADHLGAELLDQLDLGLGGAAGGQQVVVDQDAGARGTASTCISRASKPYSSAYLAPTVV